MVTCIDNFFIFAKSIDLISRGALLAIGIDNLLAQIAMLVMENGFATVFIKMHLLQAIETVDCGFCVA